MSARTVSPTTGVEAERGPDRTGPSWWPVLGRAAGAWAAAMTLSCSTRGIWRRCWAHFPAGTPAVHRG